MKKPLSDKTVELIANTQKVKDDRIARFLVQWHCDHADWVGLIRQGKDRDPNKSYVDSRLLPDQRSRIGKKVSGNKTTAKWPIVWKQLDNTNEMEIYAVIRAEYRFIKDNGWIKLHAKRNAQGMDNLFKKGSGSSLNYAIVESKCFGDRDEYDGYVRANDPNSPLKKLGAPKGVGAGGAPLSQDGVTQMSDPWISHALLQEQQAKGRTSAKRNLQGLADWMCAGGLRRMPLRYLNVYAPPKEGYYLLAGDYEVRCVVGSMAKPEELDTQHDLNQPTKGPLKVDWSDKTYEPYEFFALDKKTCKKPGIAGKYHKFWKQFRKFVARDNVNQAKAAQTKQAAISGLKTKK